METASADALALAPPPPLPRRQGRGRRLTDRERMEIIELTRANPALKHVALAERYGVNETTIRKWRRAANAAKVESRYSAGVTQVRDLRQREQGVRNAAFDAVVLDWVQAQRAARVELLPRTVRAKARELAAAFDDMRDFKASSGWFYRFCRRYGLPCLSTGRTVRQRSALTTPARTATAAVDEVNTAPVHLTPAPDGGERHTEEEEVEEKDEGEDSDLPSDEDAVKHAEEDDGAATRSARVEPVAVAGKRRGDGTADTVEGRRRQQRRRLGSPVRALPVSSLPPTPSVTHTLVFDSPTTSTTPAAPVTLVGPVTPPTSVSSATPATPVAAVTPSVQVTTTTPVEPATRVTPATPVTPVTTLTPAMLAAAITRQAKTTLASVATPAEATSSSSSSPSAAVSAAVLAIPSLLSATPAAPSAAPATTPAAPATPTPTPAAAPAAPATPTVPAPAPTAVTLAPPATTASAAATPPAAREGPVAAPAAPVTPAAAPAAAPVALATPASLFSEPPPQQLTSPPPPMSTRQEAISHFLRHHKTLVSLSCRLRFIKHLAHANEDAEMYAVMDDETRVEYIKEFAEADRVERSAAGGAGR